MVGLLRPGPGAVLPVFPGIAQNHYSPDVTLAANYTGAEQKASARSLKEVLTELRKAYGIQFSYKTDIEQDLELKYQLLFLKKRI